jgi:hypothetical protein
MLRAILMTAILVAAVPCFAQQVRVITGDIEHVYGPDGQLLDDAKLRAKNRRAERQVREQRVKADLDQQRQRAWGVQSWWCQDNGCQQSPKSAWSDPNTPRQAPRSVWSNPSNQQPPKSWWDMR